MLFLNFNKYVHWFFTVPLHDETYQNRSLQGFKFKNEIRFIDDACTVNNSDAFNESYQEIYPPDLQLKCEHSGDHTTFLELDITIVDGIFVYKLFDKRDAFPFLLLECQMSVVIYHSTFSMDPSCQRF